MTQTPERFSEKSFEVRFCATLSAAWMPCNRNPQWFGMTQAEERLSGIDTMLRIGGRLIIFQFKVKNKSDKKFRLGKYQWCCLSRIAKRCPTSTFYVFPEASGVKQVSSVQCLLKHSWLSEVGPLGKAFKIGAETTTVSLNHTEGRIEKARSNFSIPAERACERFGCFCPPLRSDSKPLGIPVYDPEQHGGDAHPDVRPITSKEDFENMLGEFSGCDLGTGLFGLFLPGGSPMGQTS